MDVVRRLFPGLRLTVCAVSFSLIAVWGGAAAHAGTKQWPTLPIGAKFAPLRQAMVAAGYRPYRAVSPYTSSTTPTNTDPKKDPLRVRFPELAECMGTGVNFCTFLFKRDGKNAIGEPDIVEITTINERPDDLIVVGVGATIAQEADKNYDDFPKP